MSNLTPIRVTGTFSPSGTQNVNIVSPDPLPVTVVAEVDFTNAVNIYGAVLVPYATVTTILSYTVPVGVTFYASQVVCWGDTNGEFLIKVNGVTKGGGRTTAAEANFLGNYVSAPIEALTGQVVTITAEHYNTATRTMKANLMGGKI